MGIRHAIRASNGVVDYINKKSNTLNLSSLNNKSCRSREKYLNDILRQFGKDNSLAMCRNNSTNYRGEFSPFIANCTVIQANWSLFTVWLHKNYSK